MPDRIVRAGILTSESVNQLSWAAEVFYRRLHNIVDDFGRYDARPTLLRAHLYPLKIDRVSDADVGKWLTECVTADLVSVYQVSGRPYLEVLKFGQRIRSEASKWPAKPASADNCPQSADSRQQLPALDVDVCVDVDVDDKPARGARGISTWLQEIGDQDAIPPEDPIFDYAKKAGIPIDFLELSWKRFVQDMTDRETRKKNWRQHYRNAVKGNWYKIWWFTPEGDCKLTTAGEQARRAA